LAEEILMDQAIDLNEEVQEEKSEEKADSNAEMEIDHHLKVLTDLVQDPTEETMTERKNSNDTQSLVIPVTKDAKSHLNQPVTNQYIVVIVLRKKIMAQV